MARLSVHLLGPFQVTLDGQPVTGFVSDKARALLAYLAAEAEHPPRRQSLAGLLWHDYPEQDARTSLRTALTNVRKLIGCLRKDAQRQTGEYLATLQRPEGRDALREY